MINNLDTPSSELQINFGVLQINAENSATGVKSCNKNNIKVALAVEKKRLQKLIENL